MIRAFIVDDELPAIQLLSEVLGLVADDVEVVGSAKSAGEAKEALSKTEVDLLFLDISLGLFTGFDVLLALGEKRKFEVIIVSAHRDKTLKALRSRVFDYLYKPLDPDELIQALARYRALLAEKSELNAGRTDQKKFAIPGVSDVAYVKHDDIVLIKAERNYSRIVLKDKTEHLMSKHLKYIEDHLEDDQFLRTHRSYLVNKRYVVGWDKKDGGFLVMENGARVPIGISMRSEVMKILKT